ncbi:MAG TPA: hypothetical protein VFP26_15070 [Gemmatimonadaceae bacterium]|nr:hypothetical protein [Gemmatimonadaceae bacterium]
MGTGYTTLALRRRACTCVKLEPETARHTGTDEHESKHVRYARNVALTRVFEIRALK